MEVEKSDVEWFLVFLTGFISLIIQIKNEFSKKPCKKQSRKSKPKKKRKR